MATMTLNLSQAEMDALAGLAAEKDLSKTGVLRQALRLYQMVHVRQKEGHQMILEGPAPQKREVELVIL